MSLKESICLFKNEIIEYLTESISRFDSIYAANSTSFIRFEFIKRVVNEFVVLAVGIRSAVVDDGENGLILFNNNKFYFQIYQILLNIGCWLLPKTLK
jgi:hypothetical protein